MAQVIEIPGYGNVEFPDSMSQDAINTVAKNLYESKNGPSSSIDTQSTQAMSSFRNMDRPETVNSPDVAPWLMDKLQGLRGTVSNLPSPIAGQSMGELAGNVSGLVNPDTLGGTAGGILGPMALGAVTGGPVGLGAGIVAGAVGGGGLQAIQDYLTQGKLNPIREIEQGVIGAGGPVLNKAVSGTKVLGSAVLRKMGLLPDLYETAINSADRIGTGALGTLAKTMPEETSAPAAQRSADFINRKIGITQPDPLEGTVKGGGVSLDWLKEYMSKQANPLSVGPNESIPIRDFEAIREDVAALGRSGSIGGKISGNWYRQVMDILRNEAASGNQAAAQLLQSADEQQALRNATPSHIPWWLGGSTAATMGLGYLTRNPAAAAAGAGAMIGIPLAKGILSAGTYNPYMAPIDNLMLEHMFGDKNAPR